MDRVAGQSIAAAQRENAAVFNSAETTFRRDPECTAVIEVKIADHSGCQSFGTCVRGAELAVPKISYATVAKSKPETIVHRVMQQKRSWFASPEAGPGDAFHHTLFSEMD
jgi:hypothetical protein